MTLHPSVESLILDCTGADRVVDVSVVQTLWSGYGRILRVQLARTDAASGVDTESVIVKHVAPPTKANHPRGWNSSVSHQRKLDSYTVESHWYEHWPARCHDGARVPRCYASENQAGDTVLVLEDLDASGFSVRRSSLDRNGVFQGLAWLANFHATFMGQSPDGLWPIGTYWHLATRPDEWAAMPDGPLKDAAAAIDAKLNACPYQTIVHGDAKVANFCFAADSASIAAVDFQYVGGGVGVKDVAYFLGSCLNEDDCESQQDVLLDFYFRTLRDALIRHPNDAPFASIEEQWRELYRWAWADFTRFMLGWCPGHAKLNRYSQQVTESVLKGLA